MIKNESVMVRPSLPGAAKSFYKPGVKEINAFKIKIYITGYKV